MSKPILSICIPTYNRAHYLKNALESIYIQLKDDPKLADQVEVSVSSNASTDATREVVDQYRSRFPNFVYSRNETNLGADMNYLRVVQHANGEYIWFLGDDDAILPGAIAFVTKLVAAGLYDVGGVEAEYEDKAKSATHAPHYTSDDVFVTDDPDTYFHKGYCRGLLSSVILKREKMLAVIDERDFMAYWLYYEAALKILGLRESKYFFVTAPMIVTGQDCRWIENGGELEAFVNSNILHTRMLNWGFDQHSITSLLETNYKKLPIMLLRAKGHDLPLTKENFLFMIKNMKSSGIIPLSLASILFYIPNPLVVWIRDIRKNFTA